MRAGLALAIFAFVMGIGLGALDRHDGARARVVLAVYVLLTAGAAVAAVRFVSERSK
jgi:uncharacterized membrane protein YoaK (UPF0700 family)